MCMNCRYTQLSSWRETILKRTCLFLFCLTRYVYRLVYCTRQNIMMFRKKKARLRSWVSPLRYQWLCCRPPAGRGVGSEGAFLPALTPVARLYTPTCPTTSVSSVADQTTSSVQMIITLGIVKPIWQFRPGRHFDRCSVTPNLKNTPSPSRLPTHSTPVSRPLPSLPPPPSADPRWTDHVPNVCMIS